MLDETLWILALETAIADCSTRMQMCMDDSIDWQMNDNVENLNTFLASIMKWGMNVYMLFPRVLLLYI